MPLIDLRPFAVETSGAWAKDPEAFRAGLLRLSSPGDGEQVPPDSVTLTGPLRVNVSVQARNVLSQLSSRNLESQREDLYCYVLDIPPGRTWTYTYPSRELGRLLTLGANAGFEVVIRPAGTLACPPAEAPGCACNRCSCDPCRCGCPPPAGADVPCDFAVANLRGVGAFFPTACEPCTPGASVGMPPLQGPRLDVPPAPGGCVRTRYFNGMFITREDLETDQRNARVKHRLQNRAMGAGVVWGLNVVQNGRYVCVLPGYGVDCCGNDVTVTGTYQVDSRALLADPAAAALLAQGGPQRFNLLLEYYECPDEPRPVHGDPCSPETTRCETSRVRETCRLRLVPPRDLDPSGPIADFLAAAGIAPKPPAAAPPAARPSAAEPAVTTPRPAGTPAPFTVTLAIDHTVTGQADGSLGTLQPVVGTADQTAQKPFSAEMTDTLAVTVTLDAAAPFRFTGGNLSGTGTPAAGMPPFTFPPLDSTPRTRIQWTTPGLPLATRNNPNVTVVFNLNSWTATSTAVNPDGTSDTETGDTQITLAWRITDTGGTRVFELIRAEVSTTVGALSEPPPTHRFPCLTEACDPDGKPIFPTLPPFLHAGPNGLPADPEVILLAVAYAILAIESARQQGAVAADVTAARASIASTIGAVLARLLAGTARTFRDSGQVPLLRDLFRAWCCSFLYPGPKCAGTPHGVVIGCATVDGGSLQGVDPWGGRRWVVHYPLLAYWGRQFGLMPLDAIASKLFDIICCVSSLGLPDVRREDGAAGRPGGLSGFRGAVLPVRGSFLVIGTPDQVDAQLAAAGIAPARAVTLSPRDLVALVASDLSRPSGPVGPTAAPAFVRYSAEGAPDLAWVSPAAAAAVVPLRNPDRLLRVVQGVIADPAGRGGVPPLLRSFAVRLGVAVAGALPLDRLKGDAAVTAALEKAGVSTVGAAVESDPDLAYEQALGRSRGAALGALLSAAEDLTRSLARVVGEVTAKGAADARPGAPDDLGDAALLDRFTRDLEAGINALEQAPPDALRALVAGAAGVAP